MAIIINIIYILQCRRDFVTYSKKWMLSDVCSAGKTLVTVSFAWHMKEHPRVHFLIHSHLNDGSSEVQWNMTACECGWCTFDTWKKKSRRIQVWRGNAVCAVNACASPSTICTCSTILPEDQDILAHHI